MTTLTDRYVWGVLRAVPEAQRAELEPEIRALVADAIDAQAATTGAGPSDPVAVERAALIELGDPESLATRYTGRSQFLIGPRLFGAWRRVAVPVTAVVVPIVSIVTLAASLLGGAAPGPAIVSMLSTGYIVAVMILFWVTLVFAVMERTGVEATIDAQPWTPDQLPEVPAPERIGLGEAIASLTASIFVAVAIVWQQAAPPVVVDGQGVPLFDPTLWSFWLPYFLAIVVLEIAFTATLYLRGRWTYPLAAVNVALNAAFAIPALWLLQNGLLFNPAVIDAIDDATGGGWLAPTAVITGLAIGIIATWDAIDGVRKAYHNAHVATMPAA
jgi:hypothetical protein